MYESEHGQQLLAVLLNGKVTVVKNIESWLRNKYERLREVIQWKDGSIYLTTSTMDGRGNPDRADFELFIILREIFFKNLISTSVINKHNSVIKYSPRT